MVVFILFVAVLGYSLLSSHKFRVNCRLYSFFYFMYNYNSGNRKKKLYLLKKIELYD